MSLPTPLNGNTVESVIKLLMTYYPHSKLTQEQLNVYKLVLGNVDPDLLYKAALLYMRSNNDYFPRPNKLLFLMERIPEIEAQKAYDDPGLMMWRWNATRNAVMRGVLPEEALHAFPWQKIVDQYEPDPTDYGPIALTDDDLKKYDFMLEGDHWPDSVWPDWS